MNEKIEKLLKALERNNMAGFFANDRNEMLKLVKTMVEKGAAVGCGDSVTLEETEVFQLLRNGDYNFFDKHKSGLTTEEKREIYIKNFSADVFVTGTNAVTLQGQLVNIDGNGSRVAPIIYGPRKVIVIVGKNKIAENMEQAIERVRQKAAPLDAKRLGKNTPCVSLGKCIDCGHSERICNHLTVTARQFDKNRIKLIIVDENLGY